MCKVLKFLPFVRVVRLFVISYFHIVCVLCTSLFALSECLSVCPYVSLSLCLYLCLSVCLSICRCVSIRCCGKRNYNKSICEIANRYKPRRWWGWRLHPTDATLIRLPLMVLVLSSSSSSSSPFPFPFPFHVLCLYYSPIFPGPDSTLRALVSCCWSVPTNYIAAHWTRFIPWLLLSLCTQKSRWKALAACHLPGQTFILLNLASQQSAGPTTMSSKTGLQRQAVSTLRERTHRIYK